MSNSAVLGLVLALSFANAQAFDVIWNRAGQGDSSRYGVWIIPLGDQNDDGFNDWGVFASGVRTEGPNHRYAEFFHGGNPPSTQPYMTWEFHSDVVMSFRSMNPIGDVNGDGYQDWVNGMRYTNRPDFMDYEIFFGGPSADEVPDYLLSVPVSGVFPGYWIGATGDFNGDGFDDIYLLTINSATSRQANIFWGGISPDAEVDWVFNAPPAPLNQPNFQSYGNLNGDTFGDFVTSGGAEDSLWVFHGAFEPDTLPSQSIAGLGSSAYIVSDINGDRLDDLLIGRFGGMDLHWGGETINSTPDHFFSLGVGGSGPTDVVGIGDVNGDGYGDIGALNDFYPSGWGGFRLYLGSPWPVSNPTFAFDGRFNDWGLVGVYRVASLGDVNGDGIDDFMVTGTNDDFDGYRGRALIFAGDTNYHVSAKSEPVIPEVFNMNVFPNPVNGLATIHLNLPAGVRGIKLQMHDVLGRRAWIESVSSVGNELTYRLDTSAFAAGVYFLSAQNKERILTTEKLVILK